LQFWQYSEPKSFAEFAFWTVIRCRGLAHGRNKRATQLLYRPSPCWGGEENGKKKAKLVGGDKDSLTEQQRKRTVATKILT